MEQAKPLRDYIAALKFPYCIPLVQVSSGFLDIAKKSSNHLKKKKGKK